MFASAQAWLIAASALIVIRMLIRAAVAVPAIAGSVHTIARLLLYAMAATLIAAGIAWFRRRKLGARTIGVLLAALALQLCSPYLEPFPLNARLTNPPAHVAQLRSILRAAADNNIQASDSAVASAADRLIANTDPQAWEIILELLDYRSSLVDPAAPASIQPDPDFAARLARFGTIAVDANRAPDGTRIVTKPRGPGMLLLDNAALRDTIFAYVPVAYTGGPLSLENVRFARCTFYVKRTPAGIDFVRSFFQSPQSTSSP